jgi:hypothetical protein
MSIATFVSDERDRAFAGGAEAGESSQAASSTDVEMGSVSLIVMEHGAAWPGRVGQNESLVAVHDEREVLLPRTRLKLESLRRKRQHLRVAVLACNAETDNASVVRRAAVAHELLGALAGGGFGRLLISTGNGASLPLRRELLNLVNGLGQAVPGTSVAVNVRFGDRDSPARGQL